MPRGVKTPEQKREQIKAIMMVDPDVTEAQIAEKTELPFTTVHDIKVQIVEEDKDLFEEIRAKRKKEFIANAWDFVEKGIRAANMKADQLLQDPEALKKARLTDITLSLAQIYDKQALASGEPTEINQSHNLSIVLTQLREAQQRVQELTS